MISKFIFKWDMQYVFAVNRLVQSTFPSICYCKKQEKDR